MTQIPSAGRTGSWIGLMMCLLLLTGGIVRAANAHDNSSQPVGFQSDAGAAVHGDYLVACERRGRPAAYCGCVFAHRTAVPPYDTVAGFELINAAGLAYERSHDPRDIPPVVFSAVGACKGLLAAA